MPALEKQMRWSFVVTMVGVALVGASAYAAPKQQAPRPSDGAAAARYFNLNGSLGDDDRADAFLKERRQGALVTAATLDICYPVVSERQDRSELVLKVAGSTLTGTGQSQVDRSPVSARLTRRATPNGVSFAGTIKIGAIELKVDGKDLESMDERDFRQQQPQEIPIEAAPSNFIETSPGSLGVRVERDSLLAVVESLKSEDVVLGLDGLFTTCAALRSGQHTLLLKVDPERAAALVSKLNGVPGVLLAGYSKGDYDNDNAVRLATRSWQVDGKLDREKLVADIAASAAKTLSATAESTRFDATTGELGLEFKRPNAAFAELGLTDVFELTMLIGPEKIGYDDAVVVWLGEPQITITDQGPEPRFNLRPPTEAALSGLRAADIRSLVGALARDLAGKIRGPGNAWKDP
jgi:hypothetical protein